MASALYAGLSAVAAGLVLLPIGYKCVLQPYLKRRSKKHVPAYEVLSSVVSDGESNSCAIYTELDSQPRSRTEYRRVVMHEKPENKVDHSQPTKKEGSGSLPEEGIISIQHAYSLTKPFEFSMQASESFKAPKVEDLEEEKKSVPLTIKSIPKKKPKDDEYRVIHKEVNDTDYVVAKKVVEGELIAIPKLQDDQKEKEEQPGDDEVDISKFVKAEKSQKEEEEHKIEEPVDISKFMKNKSEDSTEQVEKEETKLEDEPVDISKFTKQENSEINEEVDISKFVNKEEKSNQQENETLEQGEDEVDISKFVKQEQNSKTDTNKTEKESPKNHKLNGEKKSKKNKKRRRRGNRNH